jgi:predicted nucleic acid-binding protein
VRLVLDSSVLIAALKPEEPGHEGARDFMERLREAQASGEVRAFGPPELWLEVYVAEQRLAHARHGRRVVPAARGEQPPAQEAMRGLAVELVTPADLPEVTSFLELLTRRTRGRRPSANATDLVYLWAAASVGATVVTLDEGLLKYHGAVCDVTRPQHVRLGAQRG